MKAFSTLQIQSMENQSSRTKKMKEQIQQQKMEKADQGLQEGKEGQNRERNHEIQMEEIIPHLDFIQIFKIIHLFIILRI